MASNESDITTMPAQTEAPDSTQATGPRGIGTAVAFDWALAVELVFLAAGVALGIGANSMGTDSMGGMVGMPSPGQRLLMAAGLLLAAVPCALVGEGMRRGVRLLRPLQIAGNALLTLYGLVQLPGAIGDVRAGHLSAISRTVALLVISPLIVWRLSQPRTRDWFARTTSAQARARHGGRWIAEVLIGAIIGGAAIAFAGFY